MKTFYTAILILLTIFFAGCGSDDSPEVAIQEIADALNKRDEEKLSARVDTEKLFAQVYDDETIILAKDCEVYGKKYPKDPYFQHDSEFIKRYNTEHRNLHLNFVRKVKAAYFERIPAPDDPTQNPYAYVAGEFEKIREASTFTVKNVEVKDKVATATVEIKGDSTLLGYFIGRLTFKFGFEKISDKWILTKIENLDELTPPLVDKAELVWINL